MRARTRAPIDTLRRPRWDDRSRLRSQHHASAWRSDPDRASKTGRRRCAPPAHPPPGRGPDSSSGGRRFAPQQTRPSTSFVPLVRGPDEFPAKPPVTSVKNITPCWQTTNEKQRSILSARAATQLSRGSARCPSRMRARFRSAPTSDATSAAMQRRDTIPVPHARSSTRSSARGAAIRTCASVSGSKIGASDEAVRGSVHMTTPSAARLRTLRCYHASRHRTDVARWRRGGGYSTICNPLTATQRDVPHSRAD